MEPQNVEQGTSNDEVVAPLWRLCGSLIPVALSKLPPRDAGRSDAVQDFAWSDALSESNLCVPLALPVSEQLRTQTTGKASGTH